MEGVRIGTVTDVDARGMQVRVHFPDVDIVSGWLKVLKRNPLISATGTTSGGSDEDSFASHSHSVNLGHWMPSIGDAVLCLYMSGFNADGIVIGGL